MYPPLQKKCIHDDDDNNHKIYIFFMFFFLNENKNLNFDINKQRLQTSNLASVHPCPYTFLQALHSFLSGTLWGTQKNRSIKQFIERLVAKINCVCVIFVLF